MRNVRVGIIGTGVMGADHAETLAAGIAGAELIALQDLDVARARALAQSLGCRTFESPNELIASDAVDAVLVCSPDATHAPLALACIAAGKPVLVEKPLADSLEAGRGVVDAEIRGGRRLVQVGFMRRFDPGYIAMKAEVDTERLGAPLFMHCVHRNAVGPAYLTSESVLANSAVHEIDIARFVLAEDFAAATVISPRPSRMAPNRQAHLVVLETASGVVVDVEAFVDAQYGYDVQAELVCETGTVALAPNPPVARREAAWNGFAVVQDWRDRFRDAYRRQLASWVGSMATGEPVGSSAWDGYMASVTAAACLEARAQGRRVTIEPIERPEIYGR
jgi:myo-inositol 2-dehydrogenase / D-chiro-inositol 1-dehydrogenase